MKRHWYELLPWLGYTLVAAAIAAMGVYFVVIIVQAGIAAWKGVS